MAEAVYEREGAVGGEDARVLLERGVERRDVADPDGCGEEGVTKIPSISRIPPGTGPARLTLRDLEVRPQRLAKHRFPKDLSLRNLAHEQADEDEELVRVLEEARRGGEVRGPAADRLQERGVRGRVVELDRADPA